MISKLFRKKITSLQAFWMLIIACIAYVEYYHYRVRKSDEMSDAVQNTFKQQFIDTNKDFIPVKNLTNFEWDEVCAFATQTTPVQYSLLFYNNHNSLAVYLETHRFNFERPQLQKPSDECAHRDNALFYKSSTGFYLTTMENNNYGK
jgi:hypothetical protein